MRSVLDCGCVIDDAGRHWCPSCANPRPPLYETVIKKTDALVSVMLERFRQEKKWGEQNHSPEWWLAILTEEVGELAQAILTEQCALCDGANVKADALPGVPRTEDGDMMFVRKEALHVAAVALAFIECIDRHAGAMRRGQ